MTRTLAIELLAGLAVGVLACAQLSCSFDPYCVNCFDEDAGPADASAADASAEDDADPTDADPADACIPSGLEVCDGIDNDCNGLTDDGDLSGVGAPCSSDVGECEAGVTECVEGRIVCSGVLPALEICDTKDNDCDGTPDNGNPGGGAFCGTDVGECTSGITTCVDGDISCQGNYDGTDEICNGLDDDCDNEYDEDIPNGGPCGPTTDTGPCEYGVLQCVGGRMQCVGAVFPSLEQCDSIDHDCDGNPLNGFDLDNDPFNCGDCGQVCEDAVTAPDPHVSLLVCSEGACQVALCESGYWDNNHTVADGCEFGPCTYQSATDACNLQDDDCDGEVDEDAVMPADFCDPDGECADPPGSGIPMAPTCTAEGWICDYENHPSGGIVSTDGANHLTPEDLCDGLDNDCDVAVDETFGVGNTCNDGDVGRCRELGTIECAPGGGTLCNAVNNIHPGDFSETCNGVDDDCDNVVDNGVGAGALQNWVSIGGGVQMFAYEASRPDATDTSSGAIQTHPCSEPNRLPWTNVRQPDAAAACAAAGGRLCTEAEWQQACEQLEPPASPVPQGAGPNYLVWIEAEFYDDNTAQGGHSWVPNGTAGYSGMGAMRAVPDDGTTVDTNITTTSPHLEYQVNFTQTGTHYVWVRVYAADTNDDSWHMGLDGTRIAAATMDTDVLAQWRWENEDITAGENPTVINVASPGVHTLDIWMREDNLIIDAIVLTTSASYVPSGTGPIVPHCDWSYATNCTTYQPNTCNGNDYDPIPGPPDNDEVALTGEMAQCYADWDVAGHIHDLSGNVKEWTAERSLGVNPMRGGAYNTAGPGMRCDAAFTVGDDAFFFPNVGFRCCRGP